MEFNLNENHEKGICTVVILCPGLTEEDIKIRVDETSKEQNVVSVFSTVPEKLAERHTEVDFAIKGKFPISKTYTAKDAKKSVKDGVLSIDFPIADNITEL